MHRHVLTLETFIFKITQEKQFPFEKAWLGAVKNNKMNVIKSMVETQSYNCTWVKFDYEPIVQAMKFNRWHVLEFLQERMKGEGDTDGEWIQQAQNSAFILHAAAEAGSLDCIKWIVQHYPDSVQSQDNQWMTPLMLACKVGNLEAANMLLHYDQDLRALQLKDQDGFGFTLISDCHRILSPAHCCFVRTS